LAPLQSKTSILGSGKKARKQEDKRSGCGGGKGWFLRDGVVVVRDGGEER
jgi:hypothetical protein